MNRGSCFNFAGKACEGVGGGLIMGRHKHLNIGVNKYGEDLRKCFLSFGIKAGTRVVPEEIAAGLERAVAKNALEAST